MKVCTEGFQVAGRGEMRGEILVTFYQFCIIKHTDVICAASPHASVILEVYLLDSGSCAMQ